MEARTLDHPTTSRLPAPFESPSAVYLHGWSDSRITLQIRPSSLPGYTKGQYYVWVRRYNSSGTSSPYSNFKVFTFQ